METQAYPSKSKVSTYPFHSTNVLALASVLGYLEFDLN